ncbi:MAG: hypothetical protein L3J39_19535 [Verrucomicrobiales bacterium]|nr:hypothetical protein [Verrucomicrobiales bacterium]
MDATKGNQRHKKYRFRNSTRMKIISITVFPGPNRYCVRPVIRGRFDIAELQHASRLPNRCALEKTLSELIPGFSEIVATTKKNGLDITSANLISVIALALQNLSGCQLSFQQSSPITSPDNSPGCLEIVFEYESSKTARIATTLSLKILFAVLQHRFAANLPKTLQVPENYDIRQQITHFVQIAAQYSLDDSTRDIIRALEEQNIPWHRLDDTSRIIQAGYGIHRKLLVETITNQTAEGRSKRTYGHPLLDTNFNNRINYWRISLSIILIAAVCIVTDNENICFSYIIPTTFQKAPG